MLGQSDSIPVPSPDDNCLATPVRQAVGTHSGTRGRNWVRFARLRRVPRPWDPVSPGTVGNWVCFAPFSLPGPARPAELGSFCTIAPCSHAPVAPSHPVPPEIGFVLLNPFPCPIHHNSFPAEDLPFVPLPGNWLCFARLLTRETRRTWRMKSKSCLARNPGPPLGSLCLCGETFEARRLGSFCIIYVRPAPPARGLPQDVAVKRQGNRRDIPVVRGICASPVVAGPSDGLLAAPVSCRLHSILVRHVRSVNII
jgi:hypothetical protein